MAIQRAALVISALLAIRLASTEARQETDVTDLQIGVKFRPDDCSRKTKAGDNVSMHYSGYLTDGTKFDSSLDRGSPFDFKLGTGQVIKGWEQGLTNMCVGEKRKLKIPPSHGYGDRGAGGKIGPGATLIFDVELLNIS